QRFIGNADRTTCGEWESVNDKFDADPSIEEWSKIDGKVPVGEWTPAQNTLSGAVTPLMLRLADDLERIAGRGNNAVIQDFAAFAAQYQRAYVKALPTYGVHDQQLGIVARVTRHLVGDACGAVGA